MLKEGTHLLVHGIKAINRTALAFKELIINGMSYLLHKTDC